MASFKFQISKSPASPSPATGANRIRLGSRDIPSFPSFTEFFHSRRVGHRSAFFSFADALKSGEKSTSVSHEVARRSQWKGILGPPPLKLHRLKFTSGGWRDSSALMVPPTSPCLSRQSIYSPSSFFNPPAKLKSPSIQSSGREKLSIRCFRCGERGHLRKECRNGLRCFVCSGIGHPARICSRIRSPSSSSSSAASMDRSGDIARLASVRRLSLPPEPSPRPSEASNSPPAEVFIPLLQSHRTRYDELVSVGILELFPLSRGIPLPSVAQARRILEKNFPYPVWQDSWDPIPFGAAKFIVSFSSRASLLQAFRCGVLWGHKFSCSLRPWSFKEGGSPNLLSQRAFLRLSRLPLLLRNLESIRILVSGFGVLADPLPDWSERADWSCLDIAVLVEAVESIPRSIAATLGDGRYVILIEAVGSEPFSPTSPTLPGWQEGEPDWGSEEDDMDHYLDDVSDPIDLDSDALEDPSGDPVEDPEESLPLSGSPASCQQFSLSSETAKTSSSSLAFSFGFSDSLNRLSFSTSLSPQQLIAGFSPLHPPHPLHPLLAKVSICSELLASLSASVYPVGREKLAEKVDSSAVKPALPSSVPSPGSQALVSGSLAGRCSKPRRLRAVLGVKIAAAKTVSQKRAAAFLPLEAAEPELLVSWMKDSGFDVSEGRASHLISGIRSLELSKALS